MIGARPRHGRRAADVRAVGLGAGESRTARILVVLELSGGNDGLNAVVPYGDDAYYRLRPQIGIKRRSGCASWTITSASTPAWSGWKKLYKDGKLAIVHGCGYANPSFSHFTSMAYWRTAAPNSGEPFGWVGRLADAMAPSALRKLPDQYRHKPVAGRAREQARARRVQQSGQLPARSLL